MHPSFHSWPRHAEASCGPGGGGGGGGGGSGGGEHRGGPFGGHRGPPDHGHGHGPGGGHGRGFGPPDDVGAFGVRRPLRFLAHKLDLTEAQVPELARVLDELKTERAQAEVDNRRTVTAFADAMESAAFNEARSREGGELRVKSAERLREAVTLALSRIHAMLEDDQRRRLSYLIRTGVVSL